MAVFQHVFLVTPLSLALVRMGSSNVITSDKNSLEDLAGLRDRWHFLYQV